MYLEKKLFEILDSFKTYSYTKGKNYTWYKDYTCQLQENG
jgi:hypothetical protein